MSHCLAIALGTGREGPRWARSAYLQVEHARRRGRGDVLAVCDLEESCHGVSRMTTRGGGVAWARRTVEVQQLLVGGLGGELLGVGDGLFERHDGWWVVCVWIMRGGNRQTLAILRAVEVDVFAMRGACSRC